MDMRKLDLRAGLLHLQDGESVPSNVERCLENMKSLFEEADNVRFLNMRSSRSDWTEKALEMVGLSRLGNFTVQIWAGKHERIVTFEDETVSIRFIFNRVPRNVAQKVMSAMQLANGQSRSVQKDIANALIVSTLSMREKGPSPEEILLNGKSLSLEDYRLKRVERVESRAGLLKLLPQRRVVIHEVSK